MITYKHEKFIAQALDGVLMQRTSFPVELVVADDNSPDRTGAIIAEYKAKHPHSINVLKRPVNLGMMPNFADALKHCTAKYVAICEGDDYWTDPEKLQKQVDFLEKHSDYVMCFHNMQVKQIDAADSLHNPLNQPITTGLADLAIRNYIATASCVFRRVLTELPEWFTQVSAGDYTLHMLHARHGKIGYLPDVMGVYRVHEQSNWQSKSDFYKQTNWFKTLAFLLPEFEGAVQEQLVASQLAALQSALADETASVIDKSEFLAANAVAVQSLSNIVQPQFEQQRIKANSFEYRIGSLLLRPFRILFNR